MEHRSHWAVKKLNLDFAKAGKERMLQLNMLDEFRHEAFENSSILKERMKAYNDRMIEKREFAPGEAVLLFDAKLKLFAGKLKSKWSGPYLIKGVMPNGTLELLADDGRIFKVNGQYVKRFYSPDQAREVFVLKLA
ncbi:uncharacterized protein LOC125209128 [Salvia hispanica]|uniref:uncharacterized protein LOC125209128 n=1 Tax=Salvia hispanica TaxID=49212 RepID=UPI0020098C75|nr:uncharacterized protein LOC125209128 [Salvia hispanica]